MIGYVTRQSGRVFINFFSNEIKKFPVVNIAYWEHVYSEALVILHRGGFQCRRGSVYIASINVKILPGLSFIEGERKN